MSEKATAQRPPQKAAWSHTNPKFIVSVLRSCVKKEFLPARGGLTAAPIRATLISALRGSPAFRRRRYAGMMELADMQDLGSCASALGFKSPCPHHIGTQVLIRYLRSFSFCQKPINTRLFSAFANKINFIVSKSNTTKSKLSESNSSILLHLCKP